jgi:hypothetical protein
MNKELSSIQIEHQIIEVIGSHIIRQLSQQRSFLEGGDTQTFSYISGHLHTFIFQSELAYQVIFPSVDCFLARVRTLCSKPYYYNEDDCLLIHDELVSKFQVILKDSLDILDAFKEIHEVDSLSKDDGFINMSDERVISEIDSLVSFVTEQFEERVSHGVNVTKQYCNSFLILYKVRLKHRPSDFSELEFLQIIDIVLSRCSEYVSAEYLKEVA